MSFKQKGTVPTRNRGSKLRSSVSTKESFSADSKNILNTQNYFIRRDGLEKNEMAYRPEYIEVWLWYAFNALGDGLTDCLSKSQLKMLTAHIQNSLMYKNNSKMDSSKCPNKMLNDKLESNAASMSFSEFCQFLKDNQFLDFDKLDMGKLEEACWLLCLYKLQRRPYRLKAVTIKVLNQIWKLFNFFTEPDELPPVIVGEEISILTEMLMVAMGTKWMQDSFDEISVDLGERPTFTEYMAFLESKLLGEVDEMCIADGVKQVHDTLVEEIEKTGFLKKKGHNFTNWRDRYFILKPGSLSYFAGADLREQKGSVDLKANWKIDLLPDIKGYRNLFALVCEDTEGSQDKLRYDFCAPDPRCRQEWVAALKYVIKRSNKEEEFESWKALERRKNARKEKKQLAEKAEQEKQEEMAEKEKQRKAMEELQKAHMEVSKKADEEAAMRRVKEQEEAENRQMEMEQRERTQKEIEELKAAQEEALRKVEEEAELRAAREREEVERRRVEEEERAKLMKEFKDLQDALNDAEKRASVEAALKEAEKMRMLDLEVSLDQLEGLLEEERQAKRDEEIVRTLQSRLLEEETQKREELEKMQIEQERLLKQEQERREQLEQFSEELAKERKEQEQLLERERKRLKELEIERMQAGDKLQEAIDKLLLAEEKKKLEERRKRELEKPIGLARLVQPSPDPLKSSHRGVGAFTISQFETMKHLRKQLQEQQKKIQESNSKLNSQGGEDQSDSQGAHEDDKKVSPSNESVSNGIE